MFNIESVADKSRPVYGRIVDAICDAVTSGRVAAGDKLPTETALAASMGVNRLTVSRAYDDLRAKGIVTQHRRGGTRVAPDAVRLARPSAGRRVDNIAVVLGAPSISACRQADRFISTAVFEGIREVLGDRQTSLRCLTELTSDVVPTLTPDDAVLLLCESARIHIEALAALLSADVRLVSIWGGQPPLAVPSVHYDRRQSATLACEHLIQRGYRRIGFLGLKTDSRGQVQDKYATFMDALHEAGLDTRASHVRHAAPMPGEAYAMAREMIESGDLPEALFVDTDYKAMEVVHALRTAGVRVPQDIGIVSYDDIPEAATFDPPLTTVRTPRREVGRRAAQLLLDWPRGGPAPESVMLSSELIVRASTRLWPV